SRLLLLLLVLLTAVTKAKVFSQCELPHLLQEEGLDGYGGYSLANWLCMAFYKSTFNTAAQNVKADGSTDYGIFQISSQQWCTDDHSPSDNRCRMACRDLLSSNTTDDIICAKTIVRNPQGVDAW
ncbi:LYSC1 protein, partial [Pelecanoides urinatrix]|nr:LYSC1 protein [Pelecanoides urinatrix]